jgi:hypothetical protein
MSNNKDDKDRHLPNRRDSADSRRDRNLAEFFEQNLPPPLRDKPEHTGGITLDDIIARNAAGGIEGADRKLAAGNARMIGGDEKTEVKFRDMRPGESQEAYAREFYQWNLSEGKERTKRAVEESGRLVTSLVEEVRSFMKDYHAEIEKSIGVRSRENKDIRLLMFGLKKLMLGESNYGTLHNMERDALMRGTDILDRFAAEKGGAEKLYAAHDYQEGIQPIMSALKVLEPDLAKGKTV